jgi:transcriptional regulator with XRE-family HTH domain
MNETVASINRTELAQKTGMDVSAISRFLTGKRGHYGLERAKKIADALDMSLDRLYDLVHTADCGQGLDDRKN